MLNNIKMTLDKHNRTKNVFLFKSGKMFALAVTIVVNATACSTFQAAHKNMTEQNKSAVKGLAAPAVDDSFAYDKSVDEWENARAAYIRDLDYAEIFHQNNNHHEYLLKSDLIESRYDLASAETAMDEEKNFPKARTDFRLAEQRMQQAIQLANPHESKDLVATKSNLDSLQQSANLAMDHSCTYPYTDRYRKVEGNIEHLLMAL